MLAHSGAVFGVSTCYDVMPFAILNNHSEIDCIDVQFGKTQLEILRTWVAFTENSWSTLAWRCHKVNVSPNDKCHLSNVSLVQPKNCLNPSQATLVSLN